MIKSYKITYKIDDEERLIEYFCVIKEEGGRLVGVSAQNNIYDEIVFGFSTHKSISELEDLLTDGNAEIISEFEFIVGFNNMIDGVREKYAKTNGKRRS